jgi:hypothetical protein
MGTVPFPIYGEDIGSAIEQAKKIIAKIETNKYDKHDIVELIKANNVLIASLVENDD